MISMRTYYFLWFALQPWKWSQYVSPKCQHIPTRLHCVISQIVILFIAGIMFIRMICVGVRCVVDVLEYPGNTEAWMAPSLTSPHSAMCWVPESNRKGKCRELECVSKMTVLAVMSWQHPCTSTKYIIKIHYNKRRLEYQQFKKYYPGNSFLKSIKTALNLISNSLQYIGVRKQNCMCE
jgi:hypothetical protein